MNSASYSIKDVQSTLTIILNKHVTKCFVQIYTELLKIKIKAKAKGEQKEVASCCNVLGELFQQQGKYEEAISEHEVFCNRQFLICTLQRIINFRKNGQYVSR